jgi:hypothetical protein
VPKFTDGSLLDRISEAVDESKGRFIRVLATVVFAMILYGLLDSMSLKAVARGDAAGAGIDIGVGLTVFVLTVIRAVAYFIYLARRVRK